MRKYQLLLTQLTEMTLLQYSRSLGCKFTLMFERHAPGYGVRRVSRSSHYVTHDAHHSQTHSQQRTITQHDILPQHPVNIKELVCECF